ncbi:MAG: small multi-drug export protein [Ruminococcaceae bacterium]|nr:small multi-drug export protein [Oscillospiraceae bacterium]
MAQAIGRFFSEILGKHVSVFICAMLPVVELRGAIPLARVFDLQWLEAFIVSFFGNLLPIPFILLFFTAFLKFLKKFKFCGGIVNFLERKVEKATKDRENITFWGLVFFVAIPLPGTGGWTGAMAASFLKIPFWKAVTAVALGILFADIIVTIIVYGGVTALSFLV